MMNGMKKDCIRNFIDTIPLLAILGMLIIAIAYWLFASIYISLNPDAGYYLTAGKFIAQGLTPFIDFPTPYSPGVYYIFSIFDYFGFTSGTGQKLFVYFLHLVNGLLTLFLLLRIGLNKTHAIFFSSFFVLLVFTLDGQSVTLEPFQNFFILLSLIILTSKHGYPSALIVGVCIGCALMAKQSSMFSLPAIALFILFPSTIMKDISISSTYKHMFLKLCLFGFGLGIPFLLFCVLTGQDIFDTFIKLVTFGGQASHYASSNYQFRDTVLMQDGGQRLIIPFAVIAFFLITIKPSKKEFVFVVGFLFSLLPVIFVRGFGHYIQLVALWGVVFSALFSWKLTKSGAVLYKNIILILMLILIISPFLFSVQKVRLSMRLKPSSNQQKLAQEIDAFIDGSKNTLIVGYPWLYYLADIMPPDNNCAFVTHKKAIEQRMINAESVIVMPNKIDVFEEFISHSNLPTFKKFLDLKYNNEIVSIYKRNIGS